MTQPAPRRDGTCFFEADPTLSLARRAAAEGVGSFLLVFTVVSARFVWASRSDVGSIGRALAVGPVLTGMILTFGAVSGGHYNPLISLAQWFGRRRSMVCLAGYVAAQIVGAGLGAGLAKLAFGGIAPAATPASLTVGLFTAEVFATCGLMTIVLAAPRMRPAGIGPLAVGGWVGMTIVGLPTGPAANPAISFALLLSGLAPLSIALVHLAAETIGLIIALGLTAITSSCSPASTSRSQC